MESKIILTPEQIEAGWEIVFLMAGTCKVCNDKIVSRGRYHYVKCSCGSSYVDGGWTQGRCGGPIEISKDEKVIIRPKTEAELIEERIAFYRALSNLEEEEERESGE